MTLSQLFTLLRAKLIGIVLFVLATAICTVLVLFSMTPVFEAKTTLLIEAESERMVNIEEFYSRDKSGRYFNSQIEILKSRELAARVANELNVIEADEFQRSIAPKEKPFFVDWLPDWIPLDFERKERTEEEIQRAAVLFVQTNTHVLPVPQTHMVEVRFFAEDPELAARAANAIADGYINLDLEARLEITQRAGKWLTERLQGLQDSLASSQEKLQSKRESSNLVNVGGSRSIVETELTSTLDRLREARQKRSRFENIVRQIKAARGSADRLYEVSAVAENELVRKTRQAYVDAQQKRDKVASVYGKKHPKRRAVEAELRAASRSFRKQAIEAADAIVTEYDLASRDEQDLSSQAAKSKSEIQELDRKQGEFNLLEGELASNKELYDLVLTRFKESDLAGQQQPVIARIVDRALAPMEAAFPRKKLVLAAAVVGSTIIAILIVLVSQLLKTTIKTPAELEQLVGLETLGIVPLLRGLRFGKSIQTYVVHHSKTPFSEAIRTIRTALTIATLDKEAKAILVTSSTQGEGKTTTMLNLALTCATDQRVLLIETDLRRPSLAKYLEITDAAYGVSDVVQGEATLADAVKKPRDYDGQLDILLAGQRLPNPLDLLASDRFSNLIAEAKATYDLVLIDTPPCGLVSDTVMIGTKVDGAIFVVRTGHTHAEQVQYAIRQLRNSGVHIYGTVLNQFVRSRSARNGYYYGAYGNYYG